MAKIGPPVEVPDFPMDYDGIQAQMNWFDEFLESNDTIKFQVADGYAHYLVENDYTLRHIDVLDGYHAHPALLRGLIKSEIDDMLIWSESMKELFR